MPFLEKNANMLLGLSETSEIRGVQGKLDEPYICYGEEYFAQDNKEVHRFWKP